jgi:hypothetical protein
MLIESVALEVFRTLTELIDHPVELVRAVESSGGGLIRVSVTEGVR